eukprot:GHVT01010894.1.p1 GENE.GHVT01010894.1~~GHVT01010894.1.p1  ORF type:complete len:807 (+),score=123.63 GHVT01010894.1:355-2775(+)
MYSPPTPLKRLASSILSSREVLTNRDPLEKNTTSGLCSLMTMTMREMPRVCSDDESRANPPMCASPECYDLTPLSPFAPFSRVAVPTSGGGRAVLVDCGDGPHYSGGPAESDNGHVHEPQSSLSATSHEYHHTPSHNCSPQPSHSADHHVGSCEEQPQLQASNPKALGARRQLWHRQGRVQNIVKAAAAPAVACRAKLSAYRIASFSWSDIARSFMGWSWTCFLALATLQIAFALLNLLADIHYSIAALQIIIALAGSVVFASGSLLLLAVHATVQAVCCCVLIVAVSAFSATASVAADNSESISFSRGSYFGVQLFLGLLLLLISMVMLFAGVFGVRVGTGDNDEADAAPSPCLNLHDSAAVSLANRDNQTVGAHAEESRRVSPESLPRLILPVNSERTIVHSPTATPHSQRSPPAQGSKHELAVPIAGSPASPRTDADANDNKLLLRTGFCPSPSYGSEDGESVYQMFLANLDGTGPSLSPSTVAVDENATSSPTPAQKNLARGVALPAGSTASRVLPCVIELSPSSRPSRPLPSPKAEGADGCDPWGDALNESAVPQCDAERNDNSDDHAPESPRAASDSERWQQDDDQLSQSESLDTSYNAARDAASMLYPRVACDPFGPYERSSYGPERVAVRSGNSSFVPSAVAFDVGAPSVSQAPAGSVAEARHFGLLSRFVRGLSRGLSLSSSGTTARGQTLASSRRGPALEESGRREPLGPATPTAAALPPYSPATAESANAMPVAAPDGDEELDDTFEVTQGGESQPSQSPSQSGANCGNPLSRRRSSRTFDFPAAATPAFDPARC